MIKKELILEYEDVLLGKANCISPFHFENGPYFNETAALDIIKYAVETYLKWDPYTMRDCLTLEIMNMLKLKPLLRYISFPPELNPKKDLFYIAWKLYPKQITYSTKQLILDVYKDVLSGKLKRFPKEFFTGAKGFLRASICLQYFIENFAPKEDVPHLYKYFAGPKISNDLKQYKLNIVCKDNFDSPIEYLHFSLPKEQKDESLYHFFSFVWFKRKREEITA